MNSTPILMSSSSSAHRSSPVMSSLSPPKALPRRVSCTEIEGGLTSSSIPSSPVVSLESYDVVCDAAGTCYSDHVGNRRLAITLSINCRNYMNAKTLSEKKAIAASVVETVSASYRPGGRFLKCDNKNNGNWIRVDHKQAVNWIYKSFQRIVSSAATTKSTSSETSQEVTTTTEPVVSASSNTSPPRQSPPEDDTIDGQLAKLLLKQHHIFTTLSEKAEKEQKRKSTSSNSNSRKRLKGVSRGISNEIVLPRRISL